MAFALGEGLLRLRSVGAPLLDDDLICTWVPRTPFVLHPDPELRLAMRGNFNGKLVYRRATDGELLLEIPVQLSPLGLRGCPPAERPAPGTRRVLALGDSVTFGQGLREQETLPSVLQGLLSRGGPVEVINAGVPSWSLRQEVRWLELNARVLLPDVVVNLFYINDLLHIPPEQPHPAEVHLEAPPWARRERGLRRASRLFNVYCRWRERRARLQEMARWSPAPGGADYCAQLRAASTPEVARLQFSRLAAACGKARCVVALLPVLEPAALPCGAHVLDVAARAATAAGLPVLHLEHALDSLSPADRVVLRGDPHPSARAAARLARVLAEELPAVAPELRSPVAP